MRLARDPRREEDLHVAREDIGQRGAAALVGNVKHLHPRHAVEELVREMSSAAVAG
jgi:hypothetical protein